MAAQLLEKILLSQMIERAIFGFFHLPTVGHFLIVKTAQVENAVDGVTDEFLLPGHAKPIGLALRFFKANENLAVHAFFSG